MTIIMGVDPGFANTGIGVVRIKKRIILELVHYETIRTVPVKRIKSKTYNNYLRFCAIHEALTAAALRHKVTTLATEAFVPRGAYNDGWKALFGYAAVLAVSVTQRLKLHIFQPKQIKEYAGLESHKDTSKDAVRRFIAREFGLSFGAMNEHEADATALACLAWEEM